MSGDAGDPDATVIDLYQYSRFGSFFYAKAGDSDDALLVEGSLEAGEFEVRSANGVVPGDANEQASESCEQLTPQRLECSTVPISDLTILGNGGDDVLETDVTGAGKAFFAPVRISGGNGKDVLVGSSEEDDLFGGRGSDVLRGRPGDDDLNGGEGHDVSRGNTGDDEFGFDAGRDRFSGGGGNDEILARRDDIDKRINCGAGDGDVATRSRRDPDPVACETINPKQL